MPHSRRYSSHAGSSPLTRGKPGPAINGDLDLGLIPAHAGKTAVRRIEQNQEGAHPRSRGENKACAAKRLDGTGSSPLTRGKPWAQIKAAVSVGLIPAHAGKTKPPKVSRSKREAHPRSRGENLVQAWRFQRSEGSSPLTRGKRMFDVYSYTTRGLIPAHAGKTLSRSLRRSDRRAHPRSRGENTRRSTT